MERFAIEMDRAYRDGENPCIGLGDLDQFANDPSWVDWSQIMNDYADNGDSMTGIQSWPMMNSQQLDGSFM